MARHLTPKVRDHIAQLTHRGFDQNAIARRIGRSTATVSRVLKRNSGDGTYSSAQAQHTAERRRRERPLTRKLDVPENDESLRYGFAHEWSPEQISVRMKQEYPDCPQRQVSPQTIYTWSEQDKHCDHWKQHLRRRGKRPYRLRNTAQMPVVSTDALHHSVEPS